VEKYSSRYTEGETVKMHTCSMPSRCMSAGFSNNCTAGSILISLIILSNMRLCHVLHVGFLAGAAASARSPTAQFPLEPNTILTPSQFLTLDAIPLLGFGTSDLDPRNASEAVSWAIQAGFRHMDCDPAYKNEDLVGKGIADGLNRTGLKREDLWITSKLQSGQYVSNNLSPTTNPTRDPTTNLITNQPHHAKESHPIPHHNPPRPPNLLPRPLPPPLPLNFITQIPPQQNQRFKPPQNLDLHDLPHPTQPNPPHRPLKLPTNRPLNPPKHHHHPSTSNPPTRIPAPLLPPKGLRNLARDPRNPRDSLCAPKCQFQKLSALQLGLAAVAGDFCFGQDCARARLCFAGASCVGLGVEEGHECASEQWGEGDDRGVFRRVGV